MKDFVARISRNPISLLGVMITTVSAILILTLFGIELVGYHGGPYLGILAFLIFPAFFVGGLVLIPIGNWWAKRKRQRALDRGEAVDQAEFPVIDFNKPKVRRLYLVFGILSVINCVILATATYKGVETMESTQFCGKTCHTVMAPEYTSYQRSPHSHVRCVECHIGSGASWFVKSKLSGSWQLISVAFNLYQRPIPTPVHNLRPARDTCEQCHWPTKFVGDKLKVMTHFDEDEANTEKKTALLLHIGGTQGATSRGIHWHVDRGIKVEYTTDEKRENIGDVELTLADGTKRLYKAPKPLEHAQPGTRAMDCIDCHNRPTHIYRLPQEEVDTAMRDNHLDRGLPFLRREALKALKAEYASQDAAKAGIHQAITDFYAKTYPDLAKSKAKEIAGAVQALQTIYVSNVWPHMKINWGAYPTYLGHDQATGCFRCHDDEHKTADGRKISQDCTTCHTVLAQDEKDPKILRDLAGQ